MEKKRDSNYELLRIIAMIMIILWHYIVHTTFINNINPKSIEYIVFTLIKFGCAIAVNCYVLISGYYLCISKFRLKKILKLWLVIFIYSFGIQLVFYITGRNKQLSELIYSMFPIITARYWFATVYFAMYLLVPILNLVLKNINRNQLKMLIIGLVVFASIIRTIYPNNTQFASSLLLFILLYFISSYVRLYYNRKINKTKCLSLYSIIPVLLTIIQILLIKYQYRYPILIQYLGNLTWYNNLPILIESVFAFLFFKDVNINSEKVNKAICYISSLTFAIYLIHDNNQIRPWIWNKLRVDGYAISKYGLIHFVISIILVFVTCGIIEIIRRYICKKIFNKLDKNIEDKIVVIEEKIQTYIKEEN